MFFALVDDNGNKTTTKIMLFPSKYKYEYKFYAGKQDTPTSHLQRAFAAMQLLRASLHAASR